MVYSNCKSDAWDPRNFISTRDWLNIIQPVDNSTNQGKKNLNYYRNSDHFETIILTKTHILTTFYNGKFRNIYQGVNILT